MSNRQILENFNKKLETFRRSNSKELRISKDEAHEVQLAILKILLENSEQKETLTRLNLESILHSDGLDGGNFR